MAKRTAQGAHILLKISQKEKDYIVNCAKKENLTTQEYVLRKLIPEKYKSVIEWEKSLSNS